MIGEKALWEKEKMLVTSILSFSHNVFKMSSSPKCLLRIVWYKIDSLPKDKILDMFKLKAFVDKTNVANMAIFKGGKKQLW